MLFNNIAKHFYAQKKINKKKQKNINFDNNFLLQYTFWILRRLLREVETYICDYAKLLYFIVMPIYHFSQFICVFQQSTLLIDINAWYSLTGNSILHPMRGWSCGYDKCERYTGWLTDKFTKIFMIRVCRMLCVVFTQEADWWLHSIPLRFL